ncbi:MAG: hypothetical protein ISP45_03220 [Reyranella sp.]|nr:hypothetical protein [Reyranella sp.]
MQKSFSRNGLIHRPTGLWWHRSHCQNPFAQTLADDRWRVHFAGRDERNRSRGGWADITLRDSALTVLASAQEPSLDLGRLGTFDDAGAMPHSIVTDGDRHLLYYTGWTLTHAVPFQFFIGAALSEDGGASFRRLSEAPCLGRNHYDPLMTGAPWVLKEEGVWRMWYISGTSWAQDDDGTPVHYYTIKHAESADGIVWKTNAHLCFPYLKNENAVARPVVSRVGGGYSMLYSARRLGETYRIFSAYSVDGVHWERDADVTLDVAPAGWDSEMTCYGSPLRAGGRTFLLYNGNNYGKDGFGAAQAIP